MQHRTRKQTGTAVVVAAAVAIGALAVPAGARAGGAEWTATEGSPCDDSISVPVAGRYKQLYECVADRWVVSDGVGTPGPAGRDGTDGTRGADGFDGVAGAPGARGADGEDGTPGATGPAGPTGPTGPSGPAGPPGPGLTMFSGSFSGPSVWEANSDAPLLPAALEPRPGTWAVTFHVVVATGAQPVDAECVVEVDSEAAVTMLPVRATVPAGGRTTLAGTGWLTTTGAELVNVACRDTAGTAPGTVEGGTLNLLPVEQVDGPPAG